MVEAVNYLTLHPTSILYIYIVFQKLYMLWMGIWVHPYTNICAGGGRFLEIEGTVEHN
jgi:hypothetical protein